MLNKFKASAFCFLVLLNINAFAASSDSPVLKVRCSSLSPSTIKKAITGTIVEQAKAACPSCTGIKAKVSLTYPKQKTIEEETLTFIDVPNSQSNSCVAGWLVGPVCIVPNDGAPKLVAPATIGEYDHLGLGCVINGINTRITLTYRNQAKEVITKQLVSVIDLDGILQ